MPEIDALNTQTGERALTPAKFASFTIRTTARSFCAKLAMAVADDRDMLANAGSYGLAYHTSVVTRRRAKVPTNLKMLLAPR